jgi:hypothetical protein
LGIDCALIVKPPTTLVGHTNERPPVPSWQIVQLSIWPFTAEASVLDVTLPVNVILKFAPVVAELGT